MAKLTSKQATELAGHFLGLAQAIGDFRYINWNLLSKEDNQTLGNLQWSVLNYGEDILAFSTTLVMDDVRNSLEKIKSITSEIKDNIHTVKIIRKGIDVAAAIVTLGAAIISRNLQSITGSVNGLVKVWES